MSITAKDAWRGLQADGVVPKNRPSEPTDHIKARRPVTRRFPIIHAIAIKPWAIGARFLREIRIEVEEIADIA